jgi:hypothetical protein
MTVFDLYKPFRNRIGRLSRDTALYAIWAYSQWLQLKEFRLPNDIQIDPIVARRSKPKRGIYEWELELIAKEVVLHSGLTGQSLQDWGAFSTLLNELKNLENEISKLNSSVENVLTELLRIAHRQFAWQINRPNTASIARYFSIFNVPAIDKIAREKLGISIPSIFVAGMVFVGHYLQSPAFTLPIHNAIPGLLDVEIEAFLSLTCREYRELRKLLLREQLYDDRFVYAYSSLRAFPLVRMQYMGHVSIVCPIPTLLFWRLTGGLYYNLVGDKRFANPFGSSFQNYVGETIQRGCLSSRVKIFPEHEYGDTRAATKASADWMILDEDASLMIECKAKRLTWNAKTALNDPEPFKNDCADLADAIVQLYRTVQDYRAGLYRYPSFDPTRAIFPVVCTLENWHLFGEKTQSILDSSVAWKLEEAGLSKAMMDEMPYSVIPISAFENVVQAIGKFGVRAIFEAKLKDSELRQWEWDIFLQKKFGRVGRLLFEDVMEEIIGAAFSDRFRSSYGVKDL